MTLPVSLQHLPEATHRARPEAATSPGVRSVLVTTIPTTGRLTMTDHEVRMHIADALIDAGLTPSRDLLTTLTSVTRARFSRLGDAFHLTWKEARK